MYRTCYYGHLQLSLCDAISSSRPLCWIQAARNALKAVTVLHGTRYVQDADRHQPWTVDNRRPLLATVSVMDIWGRRLIMFPIVRSCDRPCFKEGKTRSSTATGPADDRGARFWLAPFGDVSWARILPLKSANSPERMIASVRTHEFHTFETLTCCFLRQGFRTHSGLGFATHHLHMF